VLGFGLFFYVGIAGFGLGVCVCAFFAFGVGVICLLDWLLALILK
jgi:hypothetical protein